MAHDITFSTDINGNVMLAKNSEYVKNTIYHLFAFNPGTDPDDMNRGLGLRTKSYKTVDDFSGYDQTIREQFNEYTDISIIDVALNISNGVTNVAMRVMFENDYYNIIVSQNSNNISTIFI